MLLLRGYLNSCNKMRATTEAVRKMPLKHKKEHSSPCDTFLKEQPSDCLGCAVRSSALFAQLDTSELKNHLKPIYNGLVEADNVIYEAGAPAKAVFTVRWGVVKLLKKEVKEKEHIVRLLGRGSAIGLEAVDGGVYEHTAITTRDVNLCRIPIASLRDLGRQNPRLAAGLLEKWKDQAAWSDKWIATLCRGKLEQRAKALVRLLSDVSGDPPAALRLLQTNDMADILGVSTEAVSRCMAEFKRRGLLERVAPWTYKCKPALLQQDEN